MKYRAAIAVFTAFLALPALAQRGFSRGGSFGNRGGGGHAGFSARPGVSARPGFSARRGFSARPGFSAPRGYAPAAPIKYGSLGPPPAVRFDPPRLSTPGVAGGHNGLLTSRPLYQPGFAGPDSAWNHNGNGHRDHDRGRGRDWDHDGDHDRGRGRDWDHDGDHDRDHDRFRGRARAFQNWYLFSYPGFFGYGYPDVLNSGFDDTSNYDNSGYDQNNQASGYNGQSSGYNDQVSGYQPEYEANGQTTIQDFGPPGEQPPPWPGPGASGAAPEDLPSDSGLHAAFEPPLEGPLTVIFKNGRAPEKMQDYMLTAKVLTDLDAHHYEQIPLEQIDVAATAQANRANGQDFRVPGAARD